MNDSVGSGNNETTAQTVASGSQDLAALAGLFATDGVEKNSLATESGYGTVISSSLSILGILGLVKSSIKVALGADRCKKSGWNVDSLRGIFGYDPADSDRSTGMDVYQCQLIDVRFEESKERIVLRKRPRKFDSDRVPLLKLGIDKSNDASDKAPDQNEVPPYTIFNMGDIMHETSVLQRPAVIGIFAVLCTGLTSWILLIVNHNFTPDQDHWVLGVAIIGLHVSLIIMLTPPLWHAHNTYRPSVFLNKSVWKALYGCPANLSSVPSANEVPIPRSFSFLALTGSRENIRRQVLHFRGDVSFIESNLFKAIMFAASALCAASYICQYTILKKADNDQAIKWIAIQAAFALARVVFWIVDPAFDDPRSEDAELASMRTQFFSPTSLMGGLTDFMQREKLENQERHIPIWAWRYMERNTFGSILEEAKRSCHSSVQDLPIPESDDDNDHLERKRRLFAVDLNLSKFLLSYFHDCWEREDDFQLINRLDMRLLLNQDTQGNVTPALIIHEGLERNLVHDDPIQGAYMKLQSQSDLSNLRNSLDDSASFPEYWSRSSAVFVTRGRVAGYNSGYYMNWRYDDKVPANLKDIVDEFLELHSIDFKYLEGKLNRNKIELLLDQSTVPVPRSFALNARIYDRLKHDIGSPMNWIQQSLRKQQDKDQRSYACSFEDRQGLFDFMEWYVGNQTELGRLKQLKWACQLSPYLFVKDSLSKGTRDVECKGGGINHENDESTTRHRIVAILLKRMLGAFLFPAYKYLKASEDELQKSNKWPKETRVAVKLIKGVVPATEINLHGEAEARDGDEDGYDSDILSAVVDGIPQPWRRATDMRSSTFGTLDSVEESSQHR